MNGVDLFSGIGGISLGLKGVVEPVAFCEIEKFCQEVLKHRYGAGKKRGPQMFTDVCIDDFAEEVDTRIKVPVDIVYGGFPCQDISASGKGKGVGEGTRSGLVFRAMEWVNHFSPTFVFLENVQGVRARALKKVLEAFDKLEYDCHWSMISASDLGAAHLRIRWFLLARKRDKKKHAEETFPMHACGTPSPVFRNAPDPLTLKEGNSDGSASHATKAMMAYGNAVVPPQVRRAFALLCGFPSTAEVPAEKYMEDAVVGKPRKKVLKKLSRQYLKYAPKVAKQTLLDSNVEMPSYGSCVRKETKDGVKTVVLHHNNPWVRKTADEALWPTPSVAQRLNAGHVRLMRRLCMLHVTDWLTGYVWCYGRCPCLEKGLARAWIGARTKWHLKYHKKHIPSHFSKCKWKRNPAFVEWLMGYPRGWCETK